MLSTLPVLVYGFEKDDVEQEEALGLIMAERCQPGNASAALSRAKVRVGRHRKRERDWNSIRVTIRNVDKTHNEDDLRMNQIFLHEILDMLPYALREEVLRELAKGDGRKLGRLGKSIARLFPFLKESSDQP